VVRGNEGGAAPVHWQWRRGMLVALLGAAWNEVVLRLLRGEVGWRGARRRGHGDRTTSAWQRSSG
jgi:hypothetical protein